NKLSAAQQAKLRSQGVQGVFIAPAGIRGAAMTIALAQRGKPYVWAAAGPGSFDCSGLVIYAYAQAGMSGLPHSSSQLSTLGVAVSRANLQAGDLVFFGSPVHHVGIYVGSDLMVDAPDFGQVVQVQQLFNGYSGARRLGP
ncbi:MAG TPA: C40 family peptidase, partial [Pseudonocardiaceae bacterium]|nr:C40 family peptidase [Pseudonocardiaceae bacterium]